jgi:hypothetical protein
MKQKMTILPALIAGLMAGCGSDSTTEQGQTVAAAKTGLTTTVCVDQNQNSYCDDGDVSKVTSAAAAAQTAAGLTVGVGQYVLQEDRDATNQRVSLLMSEIGSTTTTALSTLRSRLMMHGKTETEINTLVSKLQTTFGASLESQLKSGFNRAIQYRPLTLEALDAYSIAVFHQATVTPTVADVSAKLGNAKTEVTWSSAQIDERRQLTAQGSTVINNSESNRLYLFDAEQAEITSREIDLIPLTLADVANVPKLLRYGVALLDKAISLVIDTASAATGFTGTPSTGSPVVLVPNKGITGVQIVNSGKNAYVLMNMLSAKYTSANCLSSNEGNEGLFKISLTDTASFRQLGQTPACIHSGFSLLAADAMGSRVAAWEATAKRLWLLNGNTMTRQSTLDVKFDADKPPQAMALTAGGHYLAVAGYGRVTLIDMETGRMIHQLTGDWGNVSQVAFAAGGRRLLVASNHQVHTLNFDDSLQLLSISAVNVATTGENLRGLSMTADGDSYITASDKTVYWRSVATGAAISQQALATGLTVQQVTVAGQQAVVLARGGQDLQFKLIRLPIQMTTL